MHYIYQHLYNIIAMYTDDRIMVLNSTNGQSSSTMLIIDPVLPSDSGWYTCTAINDAGHSSQTIIVEVQCKVDPSPYPHDILECFDNFPLSFIYMSFSQTKSQAIFFIRPSTCHVRK